MTTRYNWHRHLLDLREKSIALYRGGNLVDSTHFGDEETAWLASIGLRPIHVFDFAEDFVKYEEPDAETFVLVSAVRRDFFLYEQGGTPPPPPISASDLPPKEAALQDVVWLPRITMKANCYLHGGLCHDIMYGCGGDRKFLKQYDIHPADFLRIVWACKADPARVLERLRATPAA